MQSVLHLIFQKKISTELAEILKQRSLLIIAVGAPARQNIWH